jgi:hypothetical protein
MLEKFLLAVTATFSFSLFLETNFLPVSEGVLSVPSQPQIAQVSHIAFGKTLLHKLLPL